MVLLALLLAAGLVMMGCGGDDDDPDDPGGELEEKVVFDMSTDAGIQALAAGVVSPPAAGAPNPIAPLVFAGEENTTITVLEGTPKTLEVEINAGGSWGAGLDLRFADFGFRAGDVVTVTGEWLSGTGRIQLNSSISSENAIDTYDSGEGTFKLEATLTAANISQIRGGNPAGIRIEVGRPSGNNKVRLDNIRVVGQRPSTMVDLAAPVITKTETGISWTSVEGASGYRIFNGETVLDSVGGTTTSLNITDPGTYSVSVMALGVANVSRDSPKSNVLDFEIEDTGPVLIDISIDGAPAEAEIKVVNSIITVIEDDYQIQYNGGYGSSYAQFKVNFGTGGQLSDFEQLDFTFQGVSGDTGWKGGLELLASKEELSGSINEIRPTLAVSDGSDGWSNNGLSAVNLNFKIDASKATTHDGEEELWIIINFHAAATGDQGGAGTRTTFKITNINFLAEAGTELFNLTIGPNPDGNNYQGAVPDNFGYGSKIEVGDNLEVVIKFIASRDLDNLNFQFVDNSEAGGWWTTLMSQVNAVDGTVIEEIKAGEEITATITLIASAAATSDASNANRLFVNTTTGYDSEPAVELKVLEFEITKTN